jgi:hypothetical protein
MKQNRQTLIDDLVADLKPVPHPGRVTGSVVVWLTIAVCYSIVIVLATGPLRQGALGDLLEFPGFAIETLFAIAAILGLAYGTVRSAGEPGAARTLRWSLLPLAVWVAVYVVGLRYPVHPVSTLGSRADCIWQVVLFSLPTLALMLWVARRQFPLWPRLTGFLAGAAAAAIPGELMQFGCMYVPRHILTHHIGPILITAVLGAIVAPLTVKIRATVPRRRDVSIH